MNNKYQRYIPFFYFFLLAIILLANNGSVSLWDQDEAAYAGFARGMLHSGNWLIPDFMWSDIHRKTPLHFWNICLSYKLFGINEFSVRFPSALFLFLTYLTIYRAGTPLLGKRTAFLSTVVLSTSLFVPSLAKISVTDATLLFFTTLCAFALLNIIQDRSAKWTATFWISFALALMTKGPPILIFTGTFSILLFIFHPNRKNLFSLHPWFFLPLACLPLFAWGYFVSQKDGGVFISWLIDWYILKRVNSSVLGQTGPPGTHLLSILFFFIPYLMFIPKAFMNSITAMFKKDKGINFLLSTWFISGWFIYEWSPSKLPTYVIAAHVPFAIFIAKEILSLSEQGKLPSKVWIISHFCLISIIFLSLIIFPNYLHFPPSIAIPFTIGGCLMLVINCILIYRLQSSQFTGWLIAANIFFQLLIWIFLLPQTDQLKNGTKRLAEYARENANPKSRVIISNLYGHPPSLPFYLGSTFSKVQEESDSDSLLYRYESKEPFILILDKAQKEKSEKAFPETHFEEIKSLPTDRVEGFSYYIAFNKAALKKN